jgi:hypothetical protein
MSQEKISSLFDMEAIRKEFNEVESSLKSIQNKAGFIILTEKKVLAYAAAIFIVGLTIGLLW